MSKAREIPELELGDRFWSRVRKFDGGCWQWTGSCTSRTPGYGLYAASGTQFLAHRVIWRVLHGPIPDGMEVCHHCDNPSCVRPDHLFLGTAKDNRQDAVRKGRHSMQLHPHRSYFNYMPQEKYVRGERQGSARLTEDAVRDIRRLAAEGVSAAQIARDFGRGRTTVEHVIKRRTWAHVS